MSLTSEDRIILIRVKVERAKHHLRDLATEILALEHLNIVVREKDSDVMKNVQKLSFDVVSIAGDVVHNLRASLDHLAYQLVLVGSPSTVPTRRVEFPIAETVAEYEETKARKVEGMKPEAVDVIDRLKPYKGGNDALWRIHELDNIDKHRTLFTISHDMVFVADWFDGSYLLRAENPDFAGVETKVEQDLQSEIEEAVKQVQIVQSRPLLPMLHQLVDVVEGLVLSFKPLLE